MSRRPTLSAFVFFRSVSLIALFCIVIEGNASASETLPPLSHRFLTGPLQESVSEVPDFQRHIGPLLGRLGCNGRACHGSFQGRGGFQLSLFGYDFKADHAALLDQNAGRVNTTDVDESLILAKPTDADAHEGGKRFEMGSWQYRVLQQWIASGASFSGELQSLQHIEVTPKEIVFDKAAESVALRVVAHWSDGTKEDVTELCRFTTNDDSIANIDDSGLVRSEGTGDTHVVVAYDKAVMPVAVIRADTHSTDRIEVPPKSTHPIDQLVDEKLSKLNIIPSARCSDSDFIRRASLDITGLLPSPQTVTAFLADNRADKRALMIDTLLNEPSHAAWWATRFSDWTGNSEAQLNNYFPVRGAASQFWFAWLEQRLGENVSYDKIVEGLVMAESRLPDESYGEYCETMSMACREGDEATFASRPGVPQFWARNNFRSPDERAVGFAYSFLGIRIQCAQCHKHPFDRWSKEDFGQFASLFSSIQASASGVSRDARVERDQMISSLTGDTDLKGGELRKKIAEAVQDGSVAPFPELVVIQDFRVRAEKEKNADKAKSKKQQQRAAVVSGKILGESETIVLHDDPRSSLMSWLREPANPYFSRAVVNRVWFNYFGVGIVNPTDDMNLGNPPSNAALLDYLSDEFVRSGYDLRWLHRTIVSSDTYQRSSDPNVTNVSDTRNFSRHVPRRLPAEVVRDAVYLATATDEESQRCRIDVSALAIGGQLDSYRSKDKDFALQVFGQSSRESNCDCDRSDQANLLQSIYLQNDIDMHRRLTQSNGWVAKTSFELTGKAMRSIGESNDRGKKDQAGASLRKQLLGRIASFQKQPLPRQEQLRQKLENELRRGNERLIRLGAESVEWELTLSEVNPSNNIAVSPSILETADHSLRFREWVDSAYLRTLSRYPDAGEREIAETFIRNAAQPSEGLESLLWSLLNTKEFILSH